MLTTNALFSGALLSLAFRVAVGFSFEDVPRREMTGNPLVARAENSCPLGQYYENGCMPCQAGYYCSNGTNAKRCGQGQYSGPGASDCTPCPAGTYTDREYLSAEVDELAVLTSATGVPEQGSTQCTTVQCGWYGTGSNPSNNRGSTGQQQCGSGFYSSAGSTTCTKWRVNFLGMFSASNDLSEIVQRARIVILRPHAHPLSANPEGILLRKALAIVWNAPQGHMSIGTDRRLVARVAPGASRAPLAKRIARLAQSKLGVTNGQGKVSVTSNPGSSSAQQCHAYSFGDPAPIPANCVDSNVTQNQMTCPSNTGPAPTGLRKRMVPRGCSNRKHTMCEVQSGRGGWECIDTKTALDACGSCTNDCSAIPYVGDVKCVAGKCQVASCRGGFSLEYTNGVPSCIPTTKQAFLIYERDTPKEL
ncbi:unnamed protein product [Rhizoctonia solani]|uniref:Protein CPL1-like domain-containing protein n=1 Tax=Rhizoctonia solani TaxID=456999 RepID=A0A8H3HIY0_9AGAM|nr:unnamed protein product [Rhizoctonia solani]